MLTLPKTQSLAQGHDSEELASLFNLIPLL